MDKIIQVVDTLNPGGAERVAVDLSNALQAAGHSVYFCVTRHDGSLRGELDEKIQFVNLLRRKSYQGLLTFRKFIIDNEIKIIHAHGNSTALFCVLSLLGIRSVNVIHHDHNPLLKDRNIFIQKLLLSRVQSWIAVSKEILWWVVDKIEYPNPVMMINPIQISRFYNSAEENGTTEIIVLANYREQKDYANLLFAVQQLKKQGEKFKVSCFGAHTRGDYFLKIKALVEELDIQDMIYLNSSTVSIPALLSKAHIGLLSSASEGLPISLLEYMASCLPVVVTDVGECKRIVNEANCGIVIPPNDSSALAEAIIKILRNKQKWNDWGLNGRKYVEENHSMNNFLKKMIIEVYQKI
jgi:glycosyltransferase involved in cell wall biosynthesis